MFAVGAKVQSPALAVASQRRTFRAAKPVRAPVGAHPRRSVVTAALPVLAPFFLHFSRTAVAFRLLLYVDAAVWSAVAKLLTQALQSLLL